MGKRIRSAKGEVVDFDLLTIKAQLAAGKTAKIEEPAVEVRRQENFIDKKLKRKIAKTTKNKVEQTNIVDVEPKLVDNK